MFPDEWSEGVWIQGDFRDSSQLAIALSGVDVVYHLVNASTPASSNIDKVADLEGNVTSTLHFLEACRATSVKRVIFVSSGGTVYGVPSQIPTPESSLTDPIAAYGISKLTIEKYLKLYHYLHNVDYRILRVANPFGPFQLAEKSQGVIAAFIRQALQGDSLEIWGDGLVERDYVYIDDVVAALVRVATHEVVGSRTFNIGSGKSTSLLEIVGKLEASFGRRLDVRLREGRPVDVPRSALEISLAKRELGWFPQISLDEGLRRTIDWAKTRI